MKLYELTNNFAELFDNFEAICNYEPEQNENGEYIDDDENIIPDLEAYKAEMQTAWFDTLNSIEEEFEVKAENIAAYIKDTIGDAEKLKKEEEALKKRRKTKENVAKKFIDYLFDSMKIINRTKIDTPKAKISIRNNAESVFIEHVEAFVDYCMETNQDDYLRFKQPEVNKTAVKKALQSGEALPGAVLRRTQSLIIK